MVVKQKKHPSIQSRTLNVAVVALGVALITLAVDTWFEALRSGGMTDFWGATMDPFVVVFPLLWILLGGWCLVGGIRTLIGRSRDERAFQNERLSRLHLKAIAITIGAYVFVALLHFQWHLVPRGLFLVIHYTLVTLFLLIPLTVIISLASRPR